MLEAFPYVVVRTLDAGADKPLAFLPGTGGEPNPALGERGLRMLRRHPEVLAGQLRALARAADGLPVELLVMAPMVADADGGAWSSPRRAVRPASSEPGVMIEIPAAALRARDLAAEADFFSVGTNDLAQYAFAADRQVGALSRLQDPWQPALLDLVALAAERRGRTRPAACAARPPATRRWPACCRAGRDVAVDEPARAAAPYAPRSPPTRYAQCRRAAEAARAARDAAAARRDARAELPGLTALGL